MLLPPGTTLTMVAALAVVLGLILAAARLFRGSGLSPRGPSTRGRRMQVQETLALDRARRLHLIRCDGRDLLLLTGGTTDCLVGWMPDAPEQAQ